MPDDLHPTLNAAAVLAELKNLLGAAAVISDAADCARYLTGARYGAGSALAVVRPADTEQVAQLAHYCASQQIKLVVQGANTGLVAASTPDASGHFLVLSTERLNRRIEIDVVNRSVEVDAGVTLHDLNQALEAHGLCFPVDLGANPSIGGMIAANTGGARLIKYGDVRANLLGLEAVLLHPPGTILDLRTALRKNNTGPDLKQLLVGTSGAYGIITRAVLQVHRLPQQTATALVVPRDQAAVLALLQIFEQDCGEFLSAFEGISGQAMAAVLRHVPAMTNPFAPDQLPEYCILIELDSTMSPQKSGLHLEALLNQLLEAHFGELITNALVGRGQDLWRIRHAISESLRSEGRIIAFDISMPRSSLVAFRQRAISLVETRYPHLQVMDFGHWADGGSHFNLVWPHTADAAYDAAVVSELRDAIYDMVVRDYHGSFSAEHGVGPYNQAYYHRYTSEAAQQVAGNIQNMLDPAHLFGLTWFGKQKTS
ncbi:FAD-binding oxidoreductase [Undibacterium sp. Jales W-56]|uniref:FAD-binding oxidoreductase n=1 Tax=Undibacterium sp. Jales W-56 TaxID=2897325 RepID=UPI0021D27BA0|nr:FAD-binding oxidoreductase [Undibacterium sp. Jales W-56]MCU6432545.1 FAD-binding oxidoreductase [Undibacterium sp. Jales W-56]